MQRTGQTLPCQAPSRPSYIPGHSSLNRRCNTRWCRQIYEGAAGKVGRPALDNRLFLNAVFWILRTGAPWRALPPDYGDWKNTDRRFSHWRDRGVWQRLLDEVIDDPDFEWLMIDSSHIKVHPHAAGGRGGNQEMARTKGGLNTKLHLAVDSLGCRCVCF